MKCKEERCRCGQDLTGIDVEPDDALWTLVDGERVPYTECPRCLGYCFLVEPKHEPRSGRRRAPEPEPPPPADEPVTSPEE